MIAFDFPSDTVEVFTEGDCWLLANAIHKNFELTIVEVGERKEGSWHCANLLENGNIIDIEGVYSPVEFMQRWGQYEFWTRTDFVAAYSGYDFDFYFDDAGSGESGFYNALKRADTYSVEVMKRYMETFI